MRRSRQRYPDVEKSGVLAALSALAGSGDGDRLLEAELEERFARDFDLLAARKDLHAGACRGTRASTNRCTPSTAGNRADDCTERRAAANFFGGVAAAALAFQRVVAAYDGIILAVDNHARQLELQLRTAREATGALRIREAAVDVRALSRDERTVYVEIGFEACMKNVAYVICFGIDA